MSKAANEPPDDDPKAGQKAPDFTLLDDAGQKVKLSDLKGKKVVLYFYPKDDTPGCTKEACAFRDGIDEIRDRGALVLGVSVDSVESHKKLKEQCVTVLGMHLDEYERRCQDPAYLAALSVDELRLVWQALAPYVLPRKYEHAGPEGGPIPLEVEAARNAAAERLRARMQVRDLLLRPPSAPAAPSPETPTGTTHLAL